MNVMLAETIQVALDGFQTPLTPLNGVISEFHARLMLDPERGAIAFVSEDVSAVIRREGERHRRAASGELVTDAEWLESRKRLLSEEVQAYRLVCEAQQDIWNARHSYHAAQAAAAKARAAAQQAWMRAASVSLARQAEQSEWRNYPPKHYQALQNDSKLAAQAIAATATAFAQAVAASVELARLSFANGVTTAAFRAAYAATPPGKQRYGESSPEMAADQHYAWQAEVLLDALRNAPMAAVST